MESRTCGLMPGIRDPLIATPSIQATTSTATTLRAAPPTASTARIGCQVILARMRVPANWKTAWPSEAITSTTNSAPSETHIDGAASPSRIGASQMPTSPPRSSPRSRRHP